MRASHRTFLAVALMGSLLVAACAQEAGHGEGRTDASTATSSAGAFGADTPPAATAAPDVAAVGMPAPDFTLTDVGGTSVTLSDFTRAGKTVVLEWFNPDCPVSKAYHVPESIMTPIANAYADKNVAWLAINSGGPGLQGYGVERNRRAVEEYAIPYPVLLDESGAVGRRYDAKRTPHMYVIDAMGILRYAGAIDNGNSRSPGNVNYVRQALDQLLAETEVSVPTSQAFGCGVKYAQTYE